MRNIRRQRALRRSGPQREPLVALVGYTNVGKSSLLNALTHSDALVADRPFATLDPTIRRAYLAPGSYVRLADTVGFITDLPKELVTAFRATLEELREADLLVHVLDASNAQWPAQRRAVDAILSQLELDGVPALAVFNKCDRAVPEALGQAGALYVSAKTCRGSRFAARGNPSARGSDQRCGERLIAERSPIHEIGGICKGSRQLVQV